MTAIYFNGYFPIKVNIKIIEKIRAVVEKLAGKINIKVINTGSQSSKKDDLNVIGSSLFFDR
ncbi:hypothetical protein D3C80_1874430 [compost metagenome]